MLCAAVTAGAAALPVATLAQRGCRTSAADGWEVTLAGDDEPGERLVVEGTLRDGAGKPVEGALVYVYQTDAAGYYAPRGEDQSVARLCGHMRTGKDGRYRIHTIRPGSYPGGRIPAHIHYVVTVAGDESTYLLEFTDDPLVTDDHLARDRRRHEGLDASYHGIRPVSRDASGVLKCTRDLRVTSRR